jgi:hypothetical protein
MLDNKKNQSKHDEMDMKTLPEHILKKNVVSHTYVIQDVL